MFKRLGIYGLGFCLYFFLTACADHSIVTRSQEATIPDSTLPVGSYRATLLMAPASRVLLGNNFDYELWTLELSESEQFRVKYFDTSLFEGNYSADNNEVIFSSGQESQPCRGSDGTLNQEIYNWVFDGQALTFNAIEDSCILRKQVLTSQPLLAQIWGQ